MDYVSTYIEHADSRIERREMGSAQELLNRGLEYVNNMYDVHRLIVAGQPYFKLTGTGSRHYDDVYIEEGVEGLNVRFTDGIRSVSQTCRYHELYGLVEFVER